MKIFTFLIFLRGKYTNTKNTRHIEIRCLNTVTTINTSIKCYSNSSVRRCVNYTRIDLDFKSRLMVLPIIYYYFFCNFDFCFIICWHCHYHFIQIAKKSSCIHIAMIYLCDVAKAYVVLDYDSSNESQ